MKYYIIIALILGLFSCNTDDTSHAKTENTSQIKKKNNNLHQELYPSGEVKIEGPLNSKGQKTGKWVSYLENGQKLSESNYKNDLNNGYSMVWYPSGKTRYFGDYKDGVKIGKWSFYNESGELTSEKIY